MGLVLEYHALFDEPAPSDWLHLLEGTTKVELLGLVCYANAKLSPRLSSRYDYTQKTQEEILQYILRLEPDKEKIKHIENRLKDTLIFNRPANIWAITEIINADIKVDQEESKITSVDLWNFFKFYLCINSEINKLSKDQNPSESKFDNLNASLVAHNEYLEDVDPVFTLYRGAKLFTHITQSDEYGGKFNEYISENTGLSIPQYLAEIAGMYFSDHSQNEDFRFVFQLSDPTKLFDTFSQRDIPITEQFKLEALHVRKAPFYKVDNTYYLLLDSVFLLEKCFNSLIWDFLFEKVLQGVPVQHRTNEIKKYKGFIGKFFEEYIRERIEKSFPYYTHPAPKLLSDLEHNGQELGDVYIRQNKNILLGEVKSSSIPSSSKYGKSVAKLYNEDKEHFFKVHGLDQLVNNIEKFSQNPSLIDASLNLKKRHTLYPVIITNDRALTVGFFVQIFNEQFNQRINRDEFSLLDLMPLQIIHTADLEFLEEHFRRKKLNLFKLLRCHFKKYIVITKLAMSYRSLTVEYGDYLAQGIHDVKTINQTS